jgi:hypothetical protein
VGGSLDAATFRRALSLFAEALDAHRDELNSLNVYPVPDGDTGTNLALTMRSVQSELTSLPPGASLAEVCDRVSRASLMGARGNSGVILSQVLRGLCESFTSNGPDSEHSVSRALRHASDQAYRAVARPQEGTVLTVVRAAAGAAEASGAEDPAEVADAALSAGRDALERTRDELPALRDAGVVDAGGKGAVLLFDALRAAIRGGETTEPIGPAGPVGTSQAVPPGELEFAFEVQLLLAAGDEAVASLRRDLVPVGGSIAIVGGDGLFNVHVHTNDPDAAIRLATAAGRPSDVKVVSLQEAVAGCLGGGARQVQAAEASTGMVAVADGDGLVTAFRSLGAVVVRGGPGANPPVGDLVSAILAAPAPAVVVLPNDRKVVAAAEVAAVEAGERSGQQARVVATTSIAEQLSAAAAVNPSADLDRNVRDAEAAAAACASGSVTRAAGNAHTAAGLVRGGQWLALVDGDAVAIAEDPGEALRALADALAAGAPDAEILTLIAGSEAPGDEAAAAAVRLRGTFPQLKVELIEGGQAHSAYVVGLE